MSKIKIVTDSTSDLPADLAKKYDIEIIPLNIFFGDDKYKDSVDLSPSEFYGMMESGIYEWPTTSQPSAREFKDLYEKIFSEGYESIISIHITPNMSGTLNSAQLAINQLSDKDITIIDGNTTTVPLGLLALEAAKLNKAGKSKEEIVYALQNHYVPYVRAAGVIDTLENLHKGGRIGRAAKILGTLLKLKPILQIKDGFVDSFGKVRGHDEAFKNLANMMPKVFKGMKTDTLILGYTDNKKYIEEFHDAIKDKPGFPKNIIFAQVGPTVGTHLGTGAVIIAWIGDWDENWYFGK